MQLKSKLVDIAKYLRTDYKCKKHGSYDIYDDGKVSIQYDTYYPNVQVHVYIDEKKTLAAHYSGHGYTQEFHGGAWVNYVNDILYPKAIEAKNRSISLRAKKEEERRKKLFNPLDDRSVFSMLCDGDCYKGKLR